VTGAARGVPPAAFPFREFIVSVTHVIETECEHTPCTIGLRPVRRPGARVVREALGFSVTEGVFATVTQVLVATFAIPALLTVGAGEMGVAALTGCYALLCAGAQLYAPRLGARLESRRSMVRWAVAAQAAACAVFALTGYLPGGAAVVAAVAAYGVYGVCGHIGFSPWASWMSDLVPARVRSRHFALRGMLLGAVHGGVALAAGYALTLLYGTPRNAPWAAFAFLFATAAAFRLVCPVLLGRQFEPPVSQRPPLRDFSYLQFLSKVGRGNFANFAICLALLHGGSYLTYAFFQVYFLRDLGYDYATFAVLPCCSLVATMIFVRFWGRVAERWGNRTVLRLCTCALALIPALYLLPPALPFFLAAYALGGACWAGVNLASFSYVMEASTPRRRIRCYAFMMATMLLVMGGCMLTAGWFARHLPVIFTHRLQTMFLLAAVLRGLPALAFFFVIRELSDKPPATARQIFWELPMVRSAAGVRRLLVQTFKRV
jgi:MFS family permease